MPQRPTTRDMAPQSPQEGAWCVPAVANWSWLVFAQRISALTTSTWVDHLTRNNQPIARFTRVLPLPTTSTPVSSRGARHSQVNRRSVFAANGDQLPNACCRQLVRRLRYSKKRHGIWPVSSPGTAYTATSASRSHATAFLAFEPAGGRRRSLWSDTLTEHGVTFGRYVSNE